MTRKIFSFVSILSSDGQSFKMPSLKKPEDPGVDNIQHLGYLPDTNEQFFSYVVDNTTFPDEEYDANYQFHIYDNDVKEDYEKLTRLLNNCMEVRRNVLEIGDKKFGIRPLYQWLLAIVDNDQEVIALLRDIRNAQEDYLQSLGFAGLSQFHQ